ncbi:hypothetical protein RIF25_08860 [Thermosynechococcaceae cyanobacterium BACA0444]|uniref:Uncharacterized protein n=1 Tax=Pseudocalidococcus azoricus BACA0444 TaxID=2918990 RepID=A0AAE4JZK1_9CYAN|nr:hypothetical protein [Pseudocalidococcus azoricus]MDS3860922.1 hypothetical protein [Pseudocalidococcus azoricus BACA0444]
MTTTLSAITATAEPDIFYPSEDGKPLAETSVHFDAIVDIVTTLRLYLGETGIVLSNQFFYYSRSRTARPPGRARTSPSQSTATSPGDYFREQLSYPDRAGLSPLSRCDVNWLTD